MPRQRRSRAAAVDLGAVVAGDRREVFAVLGEAPGGHLPQGSLQALHYMMDLQQGQLGDIYIYIYPSKDCFRHRPSKGSSCSDHLRTVFKMVLDSQGIYIYAYVYT